MYTRSVVIMEYIYIPLVIKYDFSAKSHALICNMSNLPRIILIRYLYYLNIINYTRTLASLLFKNNLI